MTSHTDDDVTTLISRGDWAGSDLELPAIGEVTRLVRRRRTRNRAAIAAAALAVCAVIGGVGIGERVTGPDPKAPVASSPQPATESGPHLPKPCDDQTFIATRQDRPGTITFVVANDGKRTCTYRDTYQVELLRGAISRPVDFSRVPHTLILPGKREIAFVIQTTPGAPCTDIAVHPDQWGTSTWSTSRFVGVTCGPRPVLVGWHSEPLSMPGM